VVSEEIMSGRASRYFGVRAPGEVAALILLNLIATIAAIICFTSSGQARLLGGVVVIAMVLGGVALSEVSSRRERRREAETAER